jgi:hypothetical protein
MEARMLTFSFSNEALEKALREDELLRHLMPNHWMVMAALTPLSGPPAEPPPLCARPAPRHWSCSRNKDW